MCQELRLQESVELKDYILEWAANYAEQIGRIQCKIEARQWFGGTEENLLIWLRKRSSCKDWL
jgi:hypothetical protein